MRSLLHNLRLTHWGRVTHICLGKLTIIGSDNGLSPKRHQAIIWTNAGILFIGPLGTNFSEILIATETFSFKKMRLNISSAKWRPFCLGLNVLNIDCIMDRTKAKYHALQTHHYYGIYIVTTNVWPCMWYNFAKHINIGNKSDLSN